CYLCPASSFSLQRSGPPPDHHSFPTRRSSDLQVGVQIDEQQVRALSAVEQLQRVADADGQARVVVQAEQLHGQARHVRTQLDDRSEEHTSELQSRENLVCRLLLEKKKNNTTLP